MLFSTFCGSVSIAVSAWWYELKSNVCGQMRFVYASGNDFTESSSTQTTGNRITPHAVIRMPCLTIEPHGTRRCGAGSRRATAIRSVSARVAISPCS
jgi:hypothetical protein